MYVPTSTIVFALTFSMDYRISLFSILPYRTVPSRDFLPYALTLSSYRILQYPYRNPIDAVDSSATDGAHAALHLRVPAPAQQVATYFPVLVSWFCFPGSLSISFIWSGVLKEHLLSPGDR